MGKLRHDLSLVHALMQGPAAGPLPQWLYEGKGTIADFSTTEAASLIEAAARMKRGDRVAAAQAEATDKRVRKFAGAAAHRLRSAGVLVPATTAQRWSLSEESSDTLPPATLLGMPDPDGWIPFVVVSFGASDTVALAGLAGAGFGHRDCYHNSINRSDARKLLHEARRGHALHALPPTLALHFLARAFSEGNAEPPEWSQFADLAGPGVLEAAQALEPLEGEITELDAGVLADTAPLFEARHQLIFGLSEDVASGAVGELISALTSAIEVDDASRTRRIKAVLDETADKALTAASRRAWTLAMDVLTVIAANEGESRLSASARMTSLALQADRPGRDVPFVRASVEKQLATVVEAYQTALANPAAGQQPETEA